MNERQRFRETLSFGQPDRVPLWPGNPRESTLAAWCHQGLPEGVDYYDHLLSVLGIQRVSTPLCVNLKGLFNDGIPTFFHMIPTFEEKVLEHRSGHYIVQDWTGAIVEISDRYDCTYLRSAKDFVTRKWHRFPVEGRRDWEEKVKWRYDANCTDRIPTDFEERCRTLCNRDYVVQLVIPGPFWQLREWCGFEGLCLLLVDDPGLAEEMVDHFTDFVLQTLEILLRQVKPDLVWIAEDMAYKMHSMISQAMTRRFFLPTWTKWVHVAKVGGCPVVCLDSDGYVAELLPLWIEAGFNCCTPVEVAAGNDIVAYRHEYGRQMAFMGGIDKRALAAGGEKLTAEVLRVVPPLLREGGFIPTCDHGVPPDVAWPNYVAYARLLAELTGWLR